MGVAHGDSGVVTGAGNVRQWEVEYTEDDRPYASSNTGQGTDRKCGIVDWMGRYFAYGGSPYVFPGDALSFAGEGVDSDGASGTAITERVQVYWKQEENEYCNHVVTFAGNGALTLGTISGGSDATIPNNYCGSGLIATLNGVEVADIREMYLDVMRMHGKPPGQMGNTPYSSSSVPGAIRRKKGRLDYRFWIDTYVATYESLPVSLQSRYTVKMYVNATEYWELNWGRVTRLERIGADPEGTGLLGVRIHGSMVASDGTSLGSVKWPGGTTKWDGSTYK